MSFEALAQNELIARILNFELSGITVYAAGLSFLVLLLTLTMRRFLGRVVADRLTGWAKESATEWDESVIAAVRGPIEASVVIVGLWLAIRILLGPLEATEAIVVFDRVRSVLLLLVVAWGVFRLVAVVDSVLRRRAADPDTPLDLGLVPLVTNSLRILTVMVFGTVIAQDLGYSVSGLVASLGLGGAAVALASRDAVANLFGFLMILIDKPFKVGDWIKGDGFEGVVEEIGFRSTRIRTFSKTVENIPNNVMANAHVENMDRRKDYGLNVRRIKMEIGVTYSTSADQMEECLVELRKILAEDPGVDKRMTTLVFFTDFGSSSLKIFLYYFSDNAAWDYYLEVRERVNLKIMRKIEELGLSFAFPSQSVYVESLPAELSGPDGLDALRGEETKA